MIFKSVSLWPLIHLESSSHFLWLWLSCLPLSLTRILVIPLDASGKFRIISPVKSLLPCQFSSVQFSHSVVSNSLWPHELQHARPPCPSPTPTVYSNSCPLCRWCHLTISSSVIPFSSCLQSFPASGSFQMSQVFTSGGQSTGVSTSASVLPMNI